MKTQNTRGHGSHLYNFSEGILDPIHQLHSSPCSILRIVLNVSVQIVWRLCRPRDKAHGQAVLVLHGLLRQVVGLPDAVEGAALARAHSITRQQSDKDGLHHHHGDVFSHAGTRPTAEGLEETTGNLPNRGGKD